MVAGLLEHAAVINDDRPAKRQVVHIDGSAAARAESEGDIGANRHGLARRDHPRGGGRHAYRDRRDIGESIGIIVGDGSRG